MDLRLFTKDTGVPRGWRRGVRHPLWALTWHGRSPCQAVHVLARFFLLNNRYFLEIHAWKYSNLRGKLCEVNVQLKMTCSGGVHFPALKNILFYD